MARDIISRYLWLVDTLDRYKKLTRAEINDLWLRSSLSDNIPFSERTFYNYRRGVEQNFNIEILCNRHGEYYLNRDEDPQGRRLTDWLLDSYAVNSAVKEAAATSGRIAVEDVPSSRLYLQTVIDAIGETEKLEFTYAGFNRSRHEKEIVFHPYFVKRYKQRWYMIGLKESANAIRTYALDRVKELKILNSKFVMPENVTHADLFDNILGVTSSKAPVRIVKIMADPQQAKYFRALPLHHTQQEELHDKYSIFTYRLKLNYELVHELLSYGSAVKVMAPHELQIMVRNQLEAALELYDRFGAMPGSANT